MQSIPFQTIDWTTVPVETIRGDEGFAKSRTVSLPGLRIRMMRYSPGYLADHWCRKGHIVHCLEGEFTTRMEEGGEYRLQAGQSYIVSDEQSSHRSWSESGVTLLITDGDFLAL
jgi:quercetin dioxygenase-like cupin family protein